MKINWKLRLQNKTTLVALVVLCVAFIYQILGFFNVVPAISQDEVVSAISVLIKILCLLGIVVDPTTDGISDSEQALTYEVPRTEKRGDDNDI